MSEQAKIGEGHAQAWLRAGFKELSQALVAFPAQGIQPVEEPGLAGSVTPQIATQQMGMSFEDRFNESVQRSEGMSQEPERGMEM